MTGMDRTTLLQQHQAKERQVMAFFNESVEEVKRVFFADGCEKIVGVRLQMIAAFTLAEILSNFWDCYINEKRGPDQRIRAWFDTFCAVQENETYKENPYFKNLGIDPLLSLRHSLVHFFGMSPQKIGKQIALGSSNMDPVTFEKYKKGFSSDIAVFKPVDFYNLFKDGGLLMLNGMMENVHASGTDETRKWKHVEGVDRIFQKFQSEGAMSLIVRPV